MTKYVGEMPYSYDFIANGFHEAQLKDLNKTQNNIYKDLGDLLIRKVEIIPADNSESVQSQGE
jgi:hypothetical protein